MLMDSRSIAATAANRGRLTAATEMDYAPEYPMEYGFDDTVYKKRVYFGYERPRKEESLKYGPNIAEWPKIPSLRKNLLMELASVIQDEVTTTDELIPSGETSSYRSNPLGLAEFTLSRRDPEYVGRAKAVKNEAVRCEKKGFFEAAKDNEELSRVSEIIKGINEAHDCGENEDIELGSVIYAVRPGDGSAREQAASCQRVLGGLANICSEYATKRYRSNVINWGMLPLQMKAEPCFETGDYIYIPGIKAALSGDMKDIRGYVIYSDKDEIKEISLYIAELTDEEKEIIKAGCLINYNRNRKA